MINKQLGMSMNTSTLIYTSRATTPVTMQSLKTLAETSARKNALVGTTGLLLYGSGNYFQVLEGNHSSIRILYERIIKDTRHSHHELLFHHKRPSRLFPDWNMGQLNLDNADMTGQSTWELISRTLARSENVDWQDGDPVVAWVREFMEHNGKGSAPAA